MRPNFFNAASAMALTAGASTTSAMATIAWPPLLSISFTTASASARLLRTLTTTAAPAEASSSAMARPMLRPAPVMTATRPASSLSGIFPQPFHVIPGHAEGVNPESRTKFPSCLWIPGPALRAVPE